MSLRTILAGIGKDLSHIGAWIEEGLKVAGPVAAAIDPPLGPIVTTVENVLMSLQETASEPLSSATVQAVTQSVATLETLKPGILQAFSAPVLKAIPSNLSTAVTAAVNEIQYGVPGTVTTGVAVPVSNVVQGVPAEVAAKH